MANPDSKDFENLGRYVQTVINRDIGLIYSKPKLIGHSLMRGIFTGLGGVIGATVGVGILVFILQIFGAVPLIGDFFRGLSNTIQR